MKGAGQDEVVVSADLVQAAIVECLVENQASCLVDDDEGKYSPEEAGVGKQLSELFTGVGLGVGAYMLASAHNDEPHSLSTDRLDEITGGWLAVCNA